MNQLMTYTCHSSAMPCAVTDNNGLSYFNRAMRKLLISPLSLELFHSQEEKARESCQLFSVQNKWPFGPEEKLQPYLFDFYPQFECIGTICHTRPFAFGSTLECVNGEAPRPATCQPDTRWPQAPEYLVQGRQL
ncbi:hypothetical protein [Sodalis glossinidius]|nr:hypothetical protein [Sodalis glossinidius]